MEKLVVYFSTEGNTEFIAQNIADQEKADLLKLEPKQELPKSNFIKYFWGSKQVLMREKPELKELDRNPKEYDQIFIGTPVWAGTISPPIRTFLSEYELKSKQVAFFCCHTGSEYKAFQEMERLLSDAELFGKVKFFKPLENKAEAKKKLINWLEGKIKAA
jgi:flavodoxin